MTRSIEDMVGSIRKEKVMEVHLDSWTFKGSVKKP
jgi:hypothetical protein